MGTASPIGLEGVRSLPPNALLKISQLDDSSLSFPLFLLLSFPPSTQPEYWVT